MTTSRRALWLLAIQLAIVCSIAGKFLYERWTCPRVWVQVELWDPEMLLRGRYYAFTPLVDGCALPKRPLPKPSDIQKSYPMVSPWRRPVLTSAHNGKLVVTDAPDRLPTSATSEVWLSSDCTKTPLYPGINLFIPEHANPVLPRGNQGAIWLEVTVPPAGPPRAIQLATNINGNWKVLNLR